MKHLTSALPLQAPPVTLKARASPALGIGSLLVARKGRSATSVTCAKKIPSSSVGVRRWRVCAVRRKLLAELKKQPNWQARTLRVSRERAHLTAYPENKNSDKGNAVRSCVVAARFTRSDSDVLFLPLICPLLLQVARKGQMCDSVCFFELSVRSHLDCASGLCQRVQP